MSTEKAIFQKIVAGSTPILAKDGKTLGSVQGSKILIRQQGEGQTEKQRDLNTVERIISVIDKADKISFSPDCTLILAAFYSRASIQVFSLLDEKFQCRINEGISGCIDVVWAPDSRSILSESDFGLQVSIWSLTDSTARIIQSPKVKCVRSFSNCGKLLAIVRRVELQDRIGLYSTEKWEELSDFKCKSNDVNIIQFTPSGSHIITSESFLSYKLNIYTPSGEHIVSYEAYQNALGIRIPSVFYKSLTKQFENQIENEDSMNSLASSPSAHLMAIGSFDGKIRLISMLSWQLAFVFPLCHPRDMDAGLVDCEDPAMFEMTIEMADNSIENGSLRSNLKIGSINSKGSRSLLSSVYATKPLKILPHITPDPSNTKGIPHMGTSWIGWSAEGLYLAAREESYPRCLWVWQGVRAQLVTIIVQVEAITCARWRPVSKVSVNDSDLEDVHDAIPLLAFCTGSNRVYFWTPTSGVSYVDIPKSDVPLSAQSLQWFEDGKRLLIIGRESFCTCNVYFGIEKNEMVSLANATFENSAMYKIPLSDLNKRPPPSTSSMGVTGVSVSTTQFD